MKIITEIHIFKTPENIRKYRALWDTGATETLISSVVVNDLGLKHTSDVMVSTINGSVKTKRYGCGIILQSYSKSINIQPAEFTYRKECDVIIGMDIIHHGLFVLNRGVFTFKIEQLL
jgi:hypothetical protein